MERRDRVGLTSSIVKCRLCFWCHRRQMFILFHKMASVAACIGHQREPGGYRAALGISEEARASRRVRRRAPFEGARCSGCRSLPGHRRERRALRIAASGSHARSASGDPRCRCQGRAPRAGDVRKCEARNDRRDRPQRRKRASKDRRCAGDSLCDVVRSAIGPVRRISTRSPTRGGVCVDPIESDRDAGGGVPDEQRRSLAHGWRDEKRDGDQHPEQQRPPYALRPDDDCLRPLLDHSLSSSRW